MVNGRGLCSQPLSHIRRIRRDRRRFASNRIAVSTIGRGLKELKGLSDRADAKRVRRPGGGMKTLVSASSVLLKELLSLVEPTERGDPMSPLRWTCKGTHRLGECEDKC